jgi:hypothetical protein
MTDNSLRQELFEPGSIADEFASQIPRVEARTDDAFITPAAGALDTQDDIRSLTMRIRRTAGEIFLDLQGVAALHVVRDEVHTAWWNEEVCCVGGCSDHSDCTRLRLCCSFGEEWVGKDG